MTKKNTSLKQHLRTIIFGTDTTWGLRFDQFLIYAILLSLLVVVLDSIESISKTYHAELAFFEWIFTLLFTIEYVLRVYSAPNRMKYVFSFFGVIDLLAILPTYLALMFPELQALIDVRILRLVRIFRIFKLTQYMSEYQHLADAMSASKRKILVFLSIVLMVVMVMGTLMYVVEGPNHGFTSIPVAIYWAITTMTTVGFGDITPQTDLGKLIASVMMLMGWGTLAVPTGIVTAEMSHSRKSNRAVGDRICLGCLREGCGIEDRYCSACGEPLPPMK